MFYYVCIVQRLESQGRLFKKCPLLYYHRFEVVTGTWQLGRENPKTKLFGEQFHPQTLTRMWTSHLVFSGERNKQQHGSSWCVCFSTQALCQALCVQFTLWGRQLSGHSCSACLQLRCSFLVIDLNRFREAILFHSLRS